jgi:hypothetical protein
VNKMGFLEKAKKKAEEEAKKAGSNVEDEAKKAANKAKEKM